MFKKIISWMLVITLVVTMIPMQFGTAYAESTSSIEDDDAGFIVPVEQLTEVPEGYIGIYTKEDLDNVRNDLSANYILMNDIVFEESDFEEGGEFYNEGKGWLPIGVDSKTAFSGEFNGNGFVIKNINIKDSIWNESSFSVAVGLFGCLKGTIKNIALDECCISITSRGFDVYVGGIVGIIENGEIINCYNTGCLNVDAKEFRAAVGNIAGKLENGKINDCFNSGDVNATSNKWHIYTGGIVGEILYGTITGGYNTGNITAFGNVGGIVGYNNSGTIVNFSNEGRINQSNNSSNTSMTGGISGSSIGTIMNCYNVGSVGLSFSSVVGGISGGADGTITNCYNTGEVGSYYSNDAGGIVGRGGGKITNCYNVGNIKSSQTSYVGGIAGYIYYVAKITSCYNVGKVESNYSGGIVGIADGTIANCYYLQGVGDSKKGIALSTEAMRLKSSFTGFNFEDVWTIDESNVYTLPHLVSLKQLDKIPVNLLSVDYVYTQEYTGNIITPSITVKNGKYLLKETDYSVKYDNNLNVGIGTITIIGNGEYIGETTKIFEIIPAQMEVSAKGYYGIYDGDFHSIFINFPNGATVSYSLEKDGQYSDNALLFKDVGDWTIYYKVTKPNYITVTGTEVVTITKKSVNDMDVNLEYESVVYDGTEKTPKVEVDGLSANDYEVVYSSNLNAGTATVMITGVGNYTGSVEKTFTIKPISSSTCNASLSSTTYTYDGKTKKPSVTVYDTAGKKLVNGTDYTVSYASGRKSIGRYSVTVKFKGNYSGSTKLYFTIGPKNTSKVTAALYGYDDVKISWSKVSGASGYYVYYKKSTESSYKKLKTTTSTSYKKSNLSDGVKYDFKVVAYKTVKGDKCVNSGKTAYVYTLKKLSGVKAAKSGSKVKVSWSNISGETGYQISKSTSKSKTGTLTTYKTTSGKSKTISATKGKTYYYKVRAYKVVSGKKIYAPWSSVVKYKRK